MQKACYNKLSYFMYAFALEWTTILIIDASQIIILCQQM